MPRPSRRSALLALAAALGLAACASDDGSPAGGSSGAAARASDGTSESRGGGAPTIRSFPPETQAFMEAGLRQFSRRDPRWETTRAEWLAMGDRETQFLVQMMWGALLGGQMGNAPEVVERARHELALIGEPSVPLMAGVLAAGEVGTRRDPETGEDRPIRVDDLQRREASAVLSIIGPPAVPAVVAALRDAETKSGRRQALATLGNMGERGGPEAAAALVAWSRDADEVLRVEAVHGMRTFRDPATEEALVAALGDADQLVREKAAEALASRGDRRLVPTIREAAARAQADGRLAEARRIERAANVLEKRGR